METNNIQTTLKKSSTENEIKTYFQQGLELKQSGEEFPVNLELVWPLVYSAKEKAVRALKKDFIENEDFVALAQNGEGGKFASIDYKLSISCLEYFIARKVRPVFDVYRKVFHKVAEQKPLSPAEQLLANAQILVEQEKRITNVENKLHLLEAKTTTHPDEFTIAGFATLHGMCVNLVQASRLGRMAKNLCSQKQIQPGSIPDPRFGKVHTYPAAILNEVFETPLTS
jgi:hypothetical protein